ncbi:unnamed protein product [Absidia cylindrospora]
MGKSPLMKRLLALFKKTHGKDDETNAYPPELNADYETPYALKIILKRVIAGKEHMLDSELDILTKVKHPHVVSMHAMYESADAVYIVTDLASGGELFSQLLDQGCYTERDAANLVRQMLEGLVYLHDCDIVHRDIKPENLLFATKEADATLMITDFGLSKILKNHDDILTTACGTPGYVAPEVLLQKGHGRPVDLWSVGVITFVLLCGYTPFYGEDQAALFESIMSGKYEFDEEYWGDISDSAKNMIDNLLAFDPEKRITATDALQHPWITNEEEEQALGKTNLAPGVRKGMHSNRLKSVVTAMTLLNHWKHDDLSISSDSDSEMEQTAAQINDLNVPGTTA